MIETIRCVLLGVGIVLLQLFLLGGLITLYQYAKKHITKGVKNG